VVCALGGIYATTAPGKTPLAWLRVIGDSVFAHGAVSIGWFVIGLKTSSSLEGRQAGPEADAIAEPAS
jgi:hypothetical protein